MGGGRNFSEVNPVALISVFYSTYMIGTSFYRRTLNLTIMQGYTRKQVFLSKVLIYYMTSSVIILFFLLFFFLYIRIFVDNSTIGETHIAYVYRLDLFGNCNHEYPTVDSFYLQRYTENNTFLSSVFALLVFINQIGLHRTLFSFYPLFVAVDPAIWRNEILLPITQWRFSLFCYAGDADYWIDF